MVRSGQFRQNVFAAFFAVCCLAMMASAQNLNPINLTAKLDPNPVKAGQSAKVVVTAKIDPGWHLYSLTQPPGGPVQSKLTIDETAVFKANGKATQPKPKIAADPNFSAPGQPPFMTETFDGEASFTLPIKVAADAPVGNQKLIVKFRFQVCDEHQCLPPRTKPIEVDVAIVAANANLTTLPTPGASPSPQSSASPEATASPTPETAVAATGNHSTMPPAAHGADGNQTFSAHSCYR